MGDGALPNRRMGVCGTMAAVSVVISAIVMIVPYTMAAGAIPWPGDTEHPAPVAGTARARRACANALGSLWGSFISCIVASLFAWLCAACVVAYDELTKHAHGPHPGPSRRLHELWRWVWVTGLGVMVAFTVGGMLLRDAILRAPESASGVGVFSCNATSTTAAVAASPSSYANVNHATHVYVDCRYYGVQFARAQRAGSTAHVHSAPDGEDRVRLIRCGTFEPYACYARDEAVACRYVELEDRDDTNHASIRKRLRPEDMVHVHLIAFCIAVSILTTIVLMGALCICMRAPHTTFEWSWWHRQWHSAEHV